jgi:hypothetical protein
VLPQAVCSAMKRRAVAPYKTSGCYTHESTTWHQSGRVLFNLEAIIYSLYWTHTHQFIKVYSGLYVNNTKSFCLCLVIFITQTVARPFLRWIEGKSYHLSSCFPSNETLFICGSSRPSNVDRRRRLHHASFKWSSQWNIKSQDKNGRSTYFYQLSYLYHVV